MKQTLFEKIKWAFIFWLARRLPDCKTMTPTLGESLDRKLSLNEKIVIKLHLFTCEACERYLKQVTFLREAMHAHEDRLTGESDASSCQLSVEVKNKMKELLRSSAGFAF